MRNAIIWFVRALAVGFNVVMAAIFWGAFARLWDAGFGRQWSGVPVILGGTFVTILILGPALNVTAIFWPRR